MKSLLIANRGEIAIRVIRAAAELGIHTVAVYSEDDIASLHTRKADEARPLRGQGAAAYLDGMQIIALAREAGCDAIHPGYGFLSESAAFAQECVDAGLTYVGPSPETIALFGDKVRARAVATEHAVPVLPGTAGETDIDEARAFLEALPAGAAMIIKAVAGGGGRGVRVVESVDELERAFTAAGREAQAAFGNPALYVERFLPRARHIEVQIAGDHQGAVSHFWERDCSLQRRHQKIVEFAPSPALSDELRERMLEAAVRLAVVTHYENLGTIEFLVDASSGATDLPALAEPVPSAGAGLAPASAPSSPTVRPEALEGRADEAHGALAGATSPSGSAEGGVQADSASFRRTEGRAVAPNEESFFFIEANARLQVEHTVTEEITGVDLVQLQLQLADGATLADLGLTQSHVPEPRGFAIQARVNMETMRPDGMAMPAGGTLTAFEPPTGRGMRTDTFGYTGYKTSPRFDSLLAKVIVHAPAGGFAAAVTRADRALAEFRVAGVGTNIAFLRALITHPDVVAGRAYTRFVDDHVGALIEAAAVARPQYWFDAPSADGSAGAGAAGSPNGAPASSAGELPAAAPAGPAGEPPAPLPGDSSQPAAAERAARAGAEIDRNDPLAVLAYGQQQAEARRAAALAEAEAKRAPAPDGTVPVDAPLQGTIVSLEVAAGDSVRPGQLLAIMEAMKMEHELRAAEGGTVRRVLVAVGDTIYADQPLLFVEPGEVGGADEAAEEEIDLDYLRPDVAEVLDRRSKSFDVNRGPAVERRHVKGYRTTQENCEDLFDEGTFVEYGPLVLAGQRARRTIEDLIVRSPRDGMITGVGSVNGHLFPDPVNRTAVIGYDYTVFAGTQGGQNHAKTDRMIKVAREARLPMVLFAEGGGGRPGDTDGRQGGGGSRTFSQFATLSGLVPMVGITNGRCFAGNASLLGCCDVIIATEGSNIGMGGPAMIEGGGLGIFTPEEIGPTEIQVPNGVIDILVADEAEAISVTKQYLSYFQGPIAEWEAPDQRRMRRIVPENRLRVYRVRDVIETLADVGSVLEIRRDFGIGMVTSLIRVEGHPLGVVANNPLHLGGAIDADGADKAARFLQLCDAFDIPVLFLCDTPGIMVGPEVEKTALVRHANRLFLVGANLDVTFMTVILRKAYGLGAIAMAGGAYKEPAFTVSWPTGEFGGMGLEGSVKLGYRDDLAAIEDPEARREKYEEMVARAYANGKALNQGSLFAFDDTIDPAETRYWVAQTLAAAKPPPVREGKKRAFVDGW